MARSILIAVACLLVVLGTVNALPHRGYLGNVNGNSDKFLELLAKWLTETSSVDSDDISILEQEEIFAASLPSPADAENAESKTIDNEGFENMNMQVFMLLERLIKKLNEKKAAKELRLSETAEPVVIADVTEASETDPSGYVLSEASDSDVTVEESESTEIEVNDDVPVTIERQLRKHSKASKSEGKMSKVAKEAMKLKVKKFDKEFHSHLLQNLHYFIQKAIEKHRIRLDELFDNDGIVTLKVVSHN